MRVCKSFNEWYDAHTRELENMYTMILSSGLVRNYNYEMFCNTAFDLSRSYMHRGKYVKLLNE